MSERLSPMSDANSERTRPWLPLPADLLILWAGLFAMFAPTLSVLFGGGDAGLWNKGEHSHGPIMFVVASWLLHKRWSESPQVRNADRIAGSWLAWPAFMLGLILYVSGRTLGIIYFEVSAFIPMMTAVILLYGGLSLLNKLKFPLFFFIFMVPLPGFIVDPISQFIKLRISVSVTEILWWLGYPISHTGVIISIGQYQLLVADACAGMRTLFMLEAMGIFYINVMRHASLMRNITLALLIIPISFTANLTRVMFLALLTYHFGDEVGQGFLHGFAGIFLFVVALLLIITVDAGLRKLAAARDSKDQVPA